MDSSHLFQIDNDSVVRFKSTDSVLTGLVTDQPTLAFSNVFRRQDRLYVNSSLVVQVVSTSVHLLEWDSSIKVYVERAKWDAKTDARVENRHGIVLATANCSQIALTLGGGNVVLLHISENNALINRQSLVSSTL